MKKIALTISLLTASVGMAMQQQPAKLPKIQAKHNAKQNFVVVRRKIKGEEFNIYGTKRTIPLILQAARNMTEQQRNSIFKKAKWHNC